jgi:hypothetical protein
MDQRNSAKTIRIADNIRLALFPIVSGVLTGSTLIAAGVIMLVPALYLSTRMNYAASQAHREEL